MKNLAVCWAVLLLGTLNTGCIDTGDAEDCVGLACPGGFQWPHGGEIRNWYIELPGGGHITRFFGIFEEDLEPAIPELEGARNTRPMPEIGRCAPDINAFQGATRRYIDVGPEMTFTRSPSETITVPRIRAEDNDGLPFVDPFGRQHEIIYYREDFNIPPNDYFNFKHTATTEDNLPFQVRNRVTGEYETTNSITGVYMPPAIEVLSPPPGVAQFKRGEDVTVRWRSEAPAADVVVATSIVITPAPGSGIRPTLCVAGNTGEFTVPAATIDALEADDGIMVIGLVANEAVVTDSGRILNKWGISCDLVPWVRVD